MATFVYYVSLTLYMSRVLLLNWGNEPGLPELVKVYLEFRWDIVR